MNTTAQRSEPIHCPLGTIIIYARDMKKTADFYSKHFGFETTGEQPNKPHR